MSRSTAKPGNSTTAKTPVKVAPLASTGGATDSKSKADSKPNSLLKCSASPVTAEVRRARIAEAAYYIAEQRGFGDGCDVDDWLLAERQIDATLSA